MISSSIKHLRNIDESYFQHGHFAIKQGFILIYIGLASIIHGLVPGLFTFYTSNKVEKMGEMVKKRNAQRGLSNTGPA